MDLSIVNYNLISYLIYPFISVVILYLLNSYNTMYRYININDILKLLTGIILSSLIFFIYAHNFENNFEINHLLLFFFGQLVRKVQYYYLKNVDNAEKIRSNSSSVKLEPLGRQRPFSNRSSQTPVPKNLVPL